MTTEQPNLAFICRNCATGPLPLFTKMSDYFTNNQENIDCPTGTAKVDRFSNERKLRAMVCLGVFTFLLKLEGSEARLSLRCTERVRGPDAFLPTNAEPECRMRAP